MTGLPPSFERDACPKGVGRLSAEVPQRSAGQRRSGQPICLVAMVQSTTRRGRDQRSGHPSNGPRSTLQRRIRTPYFVFQITCERTGHSRLVQTFGWEFRRQKARQLPELLAQITTYTGSLETESPGWRCHELDRTPIQLTFTANTTCPVEAGLSTPVNDH